MATACVCPDATQGVRTCAPDGAGWEPCACAPPASPAPTPAAPPSSATARGTKIAECNELIAVINQGVQNVERREAESDGQVGSGDLRAMADVLDKAAADAARVALTTPELQRFSEEYRAMAKETARATRDLATAVDADDAEGSSVAQTAVERAIQKEDPLVDRINEFCQAH
ncbi:hypothetical protein WMF26_31755 [Sorangium sp. So ce185]|uniref:hypothetical protein n=1 Tax=Sorangium sp. So ce185 TaxID=3133287 RepID=UPI003F622B01